MGLGSPSDEIGSQAGTEAQRGPMSVGHGRKTVNVLLGEVRVFSGCVGKLVQSRRFYSKISA